MRPSHKRLRYKGVPSEVRYRVDGFDDPNYRGLFDNLQLEQHMKEMVIGGKRLTTDDVKEVFDRVEKQYNNDPPKEAPKRSGLFGHVKPYMKQMELPSGVNLSALQVKEVFETVEKRKGEEDLVAWAAAGGW